MQRERGGEGPRLRGRTRHRVYFKRRSPRTLWHLRYSQCSRIYLRRGALDFRLACVKMGGPFASFSLVRYGCAAPPGLCPASVSALGRARKSFGFVCGDQGCGRLGLRRRRSRGPGKARGGRWVRVLSRDDRDAWAAAVTAPPGFGLGGWAAGWRESRRGLRSTPEDGTAILNLKVCEHRCPKFCDRGLWSIS